MRRRVALSLVVCGALLVAVAWGGRTPGAPRPEPAEPIPVRIGVPERDNLQFLNFWVASGAGFFEEEGLDVELVTPPMAGQTPQLLLQGQVDVAVLMPPLFLGMIAEEQPVELFANLLTNDPINLVVDPQVAESRQLSATAPLADRLDAIRGLRIGVAENAANRLHVLFESVGMDAGTDVEIVVLHGEDQIPALTGGTVDALYTHTPFVEEALVDHEAFLLVDQSAGEVPELAGLQIHALVTTESYVRTNPASLLRVTRAVYRAQRLIHAHPGAAVQALLASGIPGLVPARIEALVDLYSPAVPPTPIVPPDGVVRAAELFPSRPSVPDFTQIDVHDYVTNKFARKVVRWG
jgi:NitT/TauT family transport system substrate-binding protein